MTWLTKSCTAIGISRYGMKPAHAEGHVAREAGEVAEQPRGADDAEVEDAQARGAPALGDAVHGARESMRIRTSRSVPSLSGAVESRPTPVPPRPTAQPGFEPGSVRPAHKS